MSCRAGPASGMAHGSDGEADRGGAVLDDVTGSLVEGVTGIRPDADDVAVIARDTWMIDRTAATMPSRFAALVSTWPPCFAGFGGAGVPRDPPPAGPRRVRRRLRVTTVVL